ncbi:hypothetical protein LZ31DRAFT_569154 [Colletotrichum somersetense]|nr:hypothetical protein LZ31DRAFT_569154 [Colletotrichum somersetense]
MHKVQRGAPDLSGWSLSRVSSFNRQDPWPLKDGKVKKSRVFQTWNPRLAQRSTALSRSESARLFAHWSTNVGEFVLCSAVTVALALDMFQAPARSPGAHQHTTGSFHVFVAMEDSDLAPDLV